MKNRIHRLPLALALAIGTSPAWALGLGQIEVKSSLYEPLEAEVRVLSSVAGETDGLEVRLASPEAFERAGLDRPAMLAANLMFALGENDRGEPVIRITTPSRVSDPFMSFLLEVEWERGRLLREVTVLLDPPSSAPATRVAAPAPEARPAEARPQPSPTPEPTPEPAPPPSRPAAAAPATRPEPVATPSPAPAQPEPAPVETIEDGEYGPVAAGETLWSIAQRTRPDAGISVNQMMMALLRSNPEAFIDQNINRLKRGAILRLPGREQVVALAPVEANALVREQMDAWRSALPAQPQPAEPEAPASSTAAARPPREDSRLELVPPSGEPAEDARSGVQAGAEGRELRAELARAREDISARNQEIGELRSRVEELEGLQDDSQRLIDLKDSELARLQRRLAELEAQQAAEESEVEAAQAGTGEQADDAAATDDAIAADDAVDTAEAVDDAAADETEVAPATPPATTEPAPARPAETTPATATTTPPQRPAVPWYRNTLVMGIAGGTVILLGLLALLFSRRRGQAEEPVRGNRNYDSGSLAATITATKSSVQPGSDEDEREGELLDDLSEQPEDLGRHLELVRHYYEKGDDEAFEGAIEAMYAQVYDPDDLRWKQVVAMGRELLPDHPLFVATAPGYAPDEASHEASGEPTPSWQDSQAEAGSTDDTTGELEDWQPEDDTVAPADSGTTQQIRFEDLDRAAAPAEPAPDAADDGATASYELPEFEMPEAQAPTPEPEIESTAPADTASEPEPEPADFPVDEDASSTKLELARAYLDMGDVEGARGMLEEVLGEGNPGQRSEARRLLDEIR